MSLSPADGSRQPVSPTRVKTPPSSFFVITLKVFLGFSPPIRMRFFNPARVSITEINLK